jgi:nitrate reductase NapAB chaperone NapD
VAIQSFLVYTKPGCKAEVSALLAQIPGSEALPADNADLVILVTESGAKAETQSLERAIESLDGVDGFALVAGYSDEAVETMAFGGVEEKA